MRIHITKIRKSYFSLVLSIKLIIKNNIYRKLIKIFLKIVLIEVHMKEIYLHFQVKCRFINLYKSIIYI